MPRGKSKAGNESSFVWSDDEVKLLLDIAVRMIEVLDEYKVNGKDSTKDYPQSGVDINKDKVTTKL